MTRRKFPQIQPFRDKLAVEEFRKIFRPGGPTFWTVVGIGATAVASSLIAIVLERKSKTKNKKYQIPEDIHYVEVGNGIAMNISFSALPDIEAFGKKKDLDQLIVDSKNGRLRLHLLPGKKMRDHHAVEVNLSLPSLSGLAVSGNASITGDGVNETRNFTLKQFNGSVYDLTIATDKATVILSGEFKSDIAMTQGDINSEITGNGTSSFHLNNTKRASFRLGGQSNCFIHGSVKELSCHLSGKSDLCADSLTAEQSDFKMIDSAKAEVYKTDKINVSLKDNSKLLLSCSTRKQGKIDIADNAKLVYANPIQENKDRIRR